MSTKYMSVMEAAELLDVDRETVKNYLRRGVLVASKRKNGRGGYQILRTSVDAFLAEGYDVAEQSREIEQIRKDIAEEKEALKEAKEKLLAQKEMMRIKGVMYENMLEFKGIVTIAIECMGNDVLQKREHEILLDFLDGNHYDWICNKYGLTRARILQIYHKALRRLKNSKTYWQTKVQNENLKKANIELTSEVEALRQVVKMYDAPLPTDAVLVPESLIGLKNYSLSVRAYNIIKCWGVKNLWELAAYKRSDVMRLRNLGRKSMSELDMMMDLFGLEWGSLDSLKKVRNPYGDRLIEVTYARINAKIQEIENGW